MARIPTYGKDTDINDLDFILGSDGSTSELMTKNFFLGSIAEFAIDKLIDPDATQSQIPVFRNAVDSQGGNATRITSSIMTQDIYPTGTKISIAGDLYVSNNGEIENDFVIGKDLSVGKDVSVLEDLSVQGKTTTGTLQVNSAAFVGGVLTMEDSINMTENGRVINLEDPVDPQDAATKAYVDASGVNGAGTTNTLPVWTDGPNSILNDSSITQILDAGNNVKEVNILTTSGQASDFKINGAGSKVSLISGTTGNDIFVLSGDNTGFYTSNFQMRGNLAVGRSSQAQGANLDVGASANTIPAAWFRNGVVISNSPAGVQVDNTSMVIGAGNNDIISGSDHSLAVGNGNQIQTNSDNTAAIGTGNVLNGAKNSLVVGLSNSISLSSPGHSIVQGQNNTLTNSFSSFVAGGNNTVNVGQNAFVLGYSHELTGADSFIVLGENNVSQGSTNDNNVYMIGGNLHGKDGTMVLGFRNDETSYPAVDYSKGLGNTKFVIGVGAVDNTNAMIITEGGVTRGGAGVAQVPRIVLPPIVDFDYASDADATAGGIPTGGLYRTGNDLKINFNETAAGGNEGLAYLTPQLISGSGPMGGGGFSSNVNPNYNLVLVSWSGPNGIFTLNLPLASANTHRLIRITTDGSLDAGAADKINITATGGETIDGSASFQISKRYEGLAVFSTGSEWIIVQAKAH